MVKQDDQKEKEEQEKQDDQKEKEELTEQIGQDDEAMDEQKIPIKKEDKMFKEEIYDKLPFTFKQVDIFTKVIIGGTIAFVIFAIIVSNM